MFIYWYNYFILSVFVVCIHECICVYVESQSWYPVCLSWLLSVYLLRQASVASHLSQGFSDVSATGESAGIVDNHI